MTKKARNSIQLPSQISLLVQAMKCDNENAARLLIEQVMDLIYDPSRYSEPRWDEEDFNSIVSLIRNINPKDSIEMLLAAQAIALNFRGLGIIEQDNYNITNHGIMMIRLSHQALDTLQRYRGKNQNINVNYNLANKGDTVLNTLVQAGDKLKNGDSPCAS